MPLDLDPDLDPMFDDVAMTTTPRRTLRRDGMAIGFGVAFIVFGAMGLARAAGAPVPSAWLYPVILIGLGVAGLVSLFARERR